MTKKWNFNLWNTGAYVVKTTYKTWTMAKYGHAAPDTYNSRPKKANGCALTYG